MEEELGESQVSAERASAWNWEHHCEQSWGHSWEQLWLVARKWILERKEKEKKKKNQGVVERALGKESKVVVSSSRSTTY